MTTEQAEAQIAFNAPAPNVNQLSYPWGAVPAAQDSIEAIPIPEPAPLRPLSRSPPQDPQKAGRGTMGSISSITMSEIANEW